MRAELQPLDLGQVSDIRADYAGLRLHADGECDVLVVRYRGTYRDGRAGRADSRIVVALGQSAVIAFAPEGIVLDFTDLEYHTGEDLRDIFDIGRGGLGTESLPMALVVGPMCEAGARVVFAPCLPDSPTPNWIFRNVKPALAFLEVEIAGCRSRLQGIMRPSQPALQAGSPD